MKQLSVLGGQMDFCGLEKMGIHQAGLNQRVCIHLFSSVVDWVRGGTSSGFIELPVGYAYGPAERLEQRMIAIALRKWFTSWSGAPLH